VRGTWLITVAVLLWAGCKTQTQQGVPQEGVWPHVDCPAGSGIPAEVRLDEITNWAQADGSPKAMEARTKAEECARDHVGVNDEHRQEVFQAWTHAKEVATNPGLPLPEKQQLWQACVDELTHGPEG
jgi:hypothetical protein